MLGWQKIAPSKGLMARFRKAREALGISQASMSKWMAVGISTVKSWEAGRRKASGLALIFIRGFVYAVEVRGTFGKADLEGPAKNWSVYWEVFCGEAVGFPANRSRSS